MLDGSRDAFSMEYRVSAPTVDSWYLLTAERLRLSEGGAVVSHQNITSRKRAELEAEQRRQELAHVSPVSTMGVADLDRVPVGSCLVPAGIRTH